ncbi:glycine cleavage system protein T [Methylobacterium sp. Leaf104]|uniref:glycine cleavage system aminomethyltransferase GcvT n=1 Tax=Methylobacterium TaxID=407 RepID=UPI0006F2EA5C|nr:MULTISPECIES: glycine cleavage system aminomethyltransferase GcvT [Methylobacterium]KQP40831.1 glycine cleavage system protein T [Methylobacterium sp. Leaf104]MCI9880980.1 glycine cleavage system aminomethyltransferase GcvT [Methylobacterium goesingense]
MSPDVARTPLHALHLRHGGRMVPFAGYAMPVQYPAGLLKEHLHTRAQAGLFDVSHMGQIRLTPRSGDLDDAARALETLLPIDVLGLKPGRQRYGLLLDGSGGIRDDLMVAHCGDSLFLVVNAANKAADEAYLRAHLSDICEVTVLARALVALQGPGAEEVLARLAPEVAEMRFMDVRMLGLLGTSAIVTRSGYTGEDGFEISVPEDRAEALAEALLSDPAVLPIGLGARDSLRLEAGLCLHGNDIDPGTDPVEAGLSWAIPKVRRRGGARAGGFPGAGRILDALEAGPARRRVGLAPDGPTPVRAGAPLFADETGAAVGQVTSGGFGPSLQAPIAMGYLPAALAAPGTRVFAEVRGKRLAVTVAGLPFVPAGFKRT